MNTEATSMDREMIDIYSDYLITNFGQATATSLSNVLNGELSHDSITRSLADRELTSKDYWKLVKPIIREIQDENASLSVDDLIVEKPHSEESGVIAYYFDHTQGRTVKGMNIVDVTYVAPTARVPLDFVMVKKLEYKVDLQGKAFRQQVQTKNEILEEVLRFAVHNEVPFKTVLFDVWYGSADNMRLVKLDLNKEFITPLKANRKIKLLETVGSTLQAVGSLELEEDKPYLARLEGVPFDVTVVKLVFKHENSHQGVLFLCASETGLTGEEIRLGYQKRWPVEEQHKSGKRPKPVRCWCGAKKQNTGLGSSPASLVAARVNHVFCSFVGVLKLECLKLNTGLNHFALKAKLRLKAVQAAQEELNRLRLVHSSLVVQPA
jgi:DDE superfamily endonuclease